jgi:hypothetical protein
MPPAIEQIPHDQPAFGVLAGDPRRGTPPQLNNRFTNAWLQWFFKIRERALRTAYLNVANIFTENQIINKLLPELQLLIPGQTARTRLVQTPIGPGGAFTQNLFWDGTNWNLDDTALAGALIAINAAGETRFWTATAGANPRTLTERLLIANTGEVILSREGWPALRFSQTDGPSDGKNWEMRGLGAAFQLLTENDAWSSAVERLSVDRNGIVNLPGGGLTFPATQIPSADPNTLDDYEEGAWTPAITFATPGDLGVVYSSQLGTYVKIGGTVIATVSMIVTVTHTTAAGACRITGQPFVASAAPLGRGVLGWGGITKATYTQMTLVSVAAQSYAEIRASGSGVVFAAANAADMPTGGSVQLSGVLIYRV